MVPEMLPFSLICRFRWYSVHFDDGAALGRYWQFLAVSFKAGITCHLFRLILGTPRNQAIEDDVENRTR